jgi:aspartyl-tRNA(Asn)/glutamyl-tRNA(Gln) amidotransferase subunit A
MPFDDAVLFDATALAEAIRRRRISPTEVVDQVLARIERLNPRLNAFLSVFHERARDTARRAGRRTAGRPAPGPLHGVPVSVKDLILTTEAPTTAGSRIHGAGLVADRDAAVVGRLRRAGAVLLGKTNLHEVALGVTTVNEHFGPARNPWDTTRIAGGSSGGSAVAVAAGLGPLSVGTDTRGSIRIPAACCGITGLKPTRGLVPLDGVLPLSPSLDHAGPMARSAADCALMLSAMTRQGDRWRRALRRTPRGLRVGVSEYHLRDLDGAVSSAIERALAELEALGCRLREVRIPELDPGQAASVTISASEAIEIHDAHLREHPDRYGPLVRERLRGAYVWTALQYLQGQRVRDTVTAAFGRVFAEVDVLAGAVIPSTAPGIEEAQDAGGVARLVDAFTRLNSPQNLAGVPALAMPCGFARDRLPVGMQLISARGRDDVVLGLGAALQRATDWHRPRPPAS